MPHRHTIKQFLKGGYYHVYNRGVEKRTIFIDEQDYAVFLHLLKYYLSPNNKNNPHPLLKFQTFSLVRPRPLANLNKEIELIAYCLMPNHFHFLVKQRTEDGMTKLMRRLLTTYSVYFNKRYKRVGPLFQGRYKAALVQNEEYLLHLSRYIHLNPLEVSLTRTDLVNYPYSSYRTFLGLKRTRWIDPNPILNYFKPQTYRPIFLKNMLSYKNFVEDFEVPPEKFVGNLKID